MGVERQRTGLKLGSGSEPALELPWWKRGISLYNLYVLKTAKLTQANIYQHNQIQNRPIWQHCMHTIGQNKRLSLAREEGNPPK